MKNKKALVMGQVFIYIVAVIVFAVILIFGYQAITGFLEKGEKVAYVTFVTDLENAIKNVYSDFGTVVIYDTQHPFSVPDKYDEICFVNLNKEPPGDLSLTRPLMYDVWSTAFGRGGWSGGDQNVFLTPQGLSAIKVYKIDAEGGSGYLCLPVIQGRLFMRLEGKGDHTFISKVEP